MAVSALESTLDANAARLILATTAEIEGRPVVEYLGIVSGEAEMSAMPGADPGGRTLPRSRSRSTVFGNLVDETRDQALALMSRTALELGANAVIAIDIDYLVIPQQSGGDRLIITVTGTAVTV
jgi:uncharacterized protein YbjQ (UPF0145 family)